MENTVRAQDKDLKHQHATVRRFGLDTSHQRFATVVRVLHPLEILRNETGPIHREIIDQLIKRMQYGMHVRLSHPRYSTLMASRSLAASHDRRKRGLCDYDFLSRS